MSIDHYLTHYGIQTIEGNSGDVPEQTKRLKEFAQNIQFKNILEIGFNAGHSADTFLSSSIAHVTSFDIQTNPYVVLSKKYIDQKYPTRHTLIIGDSKITISEYKQRNPEVKFDIIFIDGDHSFDGALMDIQNCKELAHERTLLIIDDVLVNSNQHQEYTIGPTNAWVHAINNRMITYIGHDQYAGCRGMVWGNYIF